MASILNATTSSGLVTSADNSGVLQLATNNGTTAVTITTGQNVGIGVTATTQKLWVESGRVGLTNAYKLGWHSNPSAADLNNYITGDDSTNYVAIGTGAVERMRIASDGTISTTIGSTLYGAYSARAWVNFNGTGTVAIRQSRNVSSITDNNTGDYTVNLTTAMPDGEYSAVSSGGTGGNNIRMCSCSPVSTTSTSQIRVIGITSGAGSLIDLEVVSVAIFR
jgi:hypothetical protein